jgi:hypothetical protein
MSDLRTESDGAFGGAGPPVLRHPVVKISNVVYDALLSNFEERRAAPSDPKFVEGRLADAQVFGSLRGIELLPKFAEILFDFAHLMLSDIPEEQQRSPECARREMATQKRAV